VPESTGSEGSGVNVVALNLGKAGAHLLEAKKLLIAAADSAAGRPEHAETIQDMIGLCPRLDELISDVAGALQTSEEARP
jgi:hypothetical protein